MYSILLKGVTNTFFVFVIMLKSNAIGLYFETVILRFNGK